MEHLDVIRQSKNPEKGSSILQTKASGEYFTPEIVGRKLAQDVLRSFRRRPTSVSAIDPFCGDGRLLVWLVEEMVTVAPYLRDVSWNLFLWDISLQNVLDATEKVRDAVSRIGIDATVNVRVCDSFEEALPFKGSFDIIITNPPWELLKPDKRDLHYLDIDDASAYVESLKSLAKRLSLSFPRSVPSRAFSGWGLNLSRVGLEAALSLLSYQGVAGVIMPASFLADQTSVELRRWLIEGTLCHSIAFYPAEARLFDGVDQPFSTIVTEAITLPNFTQPQTTIVTYNQALDVSNAVTLNLREDWIRLSGYCVPMSLSEFQINALKVIQTHPRVSDLEGVHPGELWIGREIDETNLSSFTSHAGQIRFLKGINIESYRVREDIAPIYVDSNQLERLPTSTRFARLIWRDVSRPSQKRRMHVTVIPAGCVTGNSLNVMHDWCQEAEGLLWFLAVTASLTFEFQVRNLLKTGHVSSGVVRRSAVPLPESTPLFQRVVTLVKRRLAGDEMVAFYLEVLVAQCYGLDRDTFSVLLECFPKLSDVEKKELLDDSLWRDLYV